MEQIIKICGVDYTIEEKECISKYGRIYGQVTFGEQIIELEKGLSGDRRSIVLFHEIIHAIMYELGFQEQGNEPLVQALANGIYQVLKENKDVMVFNMPRISRDNIGEKRAAGT